MRTIKLMLIAFVGLNVMGSGLHGSRPVWAEPSEGIGAGTRLKGTRIGRQDNCPMHVSGATVTGMNVEGGVAMVFLTKSGDVIEVRRRVAHMADMHNRHNASGGWMMGGPGMGSHGKRSGPTMLGDGMMMPAATASTEDLPFGSQLILKPTAPSGLESLRAHARMRISRMGHGECPMISASAPVQKKRPSSSKAPESTKATIQ